MSTASTWSEDCARGLAHPVSALARQARVEEFHRGEESRKAQLTHALHLLRASLKTEAELVELLHCASSTLAPKAMHSSDLHETVEGLEALANSIEFRY